MISEERDFLIISMLDEQGVVSLQALAHACPDVSSVTLRRDLARLERAGRLRRTRGGAIRVEPRDASSTAERTLAALPARPDALILPPLSGSWAQTLRQQAVRSRVPFLAESAPQAGGLYLGPDNWSRSRELGRHGGREVAGVSEAAEILLISLDELTNATDRMNGFLAGFRETFPGQVTAHQVQGRGFLKDVVRQARDAFRTHPGINVVFGVNDHTVLGALEMAERLGRDVLAYSVGGEGDALFDTLASGGPLRATLALFPEVVGRVAIDTVCRCFAGEAIGEAVITPAEVLTPETLPDFYRREADRWRLDPAVLDRMAAPHAYSGPPPGDRTVSFVLHFPSHDWYRKLAAAMRERCASLGLRFEARNAGDQVADQIRENRRLIAAGVAADIAPHETILLDGGEASRFLAEALAAEPRDLTVVTNSLVVLETLADAAPIKVLLTGGEFQPATRSLVGPSVGALLETMRVDRSFVSPDGVSPVFGLSFQDERAALVCRRFALAARQVVVLADHSVLGFEAHVQAIRPNQFHAVYTDAGTLSSHRLDLAAAGVRVVVADDEEEEGLAEDLRQPMRKAV
jgi:DeoR/GlpR family transcriptional regulator of sugar metabolism/DNA-binding LacI/PurR family transcriptional regulator